jgi:hypothetical protein
LFHDIQYGDDTYRSFKPKYQTKTGFPFIKAFTSKGIPIFCKVGKPISLKDNPEITLQECFKVVKQNMKILPHYFISRLLTTDPSGVAGRWKTSGINGLMEPSRALRNKLPKVQTDEAYYNDDGLADIISIGMEFLIWGRYVGSDGQIRNDRILEYYSNKIPDLNLYRDS